MKEEPPHDQELCEMLINADRQGKLITQLCNFDRRGVSSITEIISNLNNDGKIALLATRNLDAIKNLRHDDFWSIQNSLSEIIPTLKCETTALLHFVRTMVEKAGNDLAAYSPVSSLTKWCSHNSAQAYEIIEGSRQSDELCLQYCVCALEGLGNFKLIREFASNDDTALSIIGIRAMGLLGNELPVISAKESIKKCLETLNNLDNGEARLTSIESAFRIWNENKKIGHYLQTPFIKAVTASNVDEERQMLVYCLYRYVGGLTEKSIESILKHATNNSENSEALLRMLDQALGGFDERWNFEQVVDVFNSHMPHVSDNFDIRDLSYFFDMVWNAPSNTSYVFSSWLYLGDIQQCTKLAYAIDEKGGNDVTLSFLKQHVPEYANDQIFIAKKCIGFLWKNEVTAASILLSLYKYSSKEAQTVIEELLFDPLLVSYN
ncbi:MAG: hypothetical protein V6Z81_03275 [Parvularculales bacterium]